MTPSGQLLEFNSAKPVSDVLQNFPGNGVFRRDQLLSPLDHSELLIGGGLYYLFPLASDEKDRNMKEKASSGLEPVRVSSVAEGEPEVNTEALIEQMRIAAASSMTVGPRQSKGLLGNQLEADIFVM
ncbi:hypothetical protein Tco_1219325 [Tanacetum coccineum]